MHHASLSLMSTHDQYPVILILIHRPWNAQDFTQLCVRLRACVSGSATNTRIGHIYAVGLNATVPNTQVFAQNPVLMNQTPAWAENCFVRQECLCLQFQGAAVYVKPTTHSAQYRVLPGLPKRHQNVQLQKHFNIKPE